MSAEPGLVAPAFVLGLDIEEVYAIFGESIQVSMGGALDPAHYEDVERKAQRVRDALLDFRLPFELVEWFEAITARIYRAGDPRAADLNRVSEESMQAGENLSALMHEVRKQLEPDDMALYDLGVMLARLHLCFRVLVPTEGTSPRERRDVYAAELERVVPIVASFLAAGADAVARAGAPEFEQRVRSLTLAVEAWDGGSEDWCRATRERLERVFAAAGMLPRLASVPPRSDEDEAVEAGVRALRDARAHAKELFESRDFAGAEREQRALLEECRRRIGYDNPFTLSVRADLTMSLLGSEQADLAVEEAYSFAEDAERTFGERNPNTARAQIHTLFILMCTSAFDEVIDFRMSRLGWLDSADPSSLDPELAEAQRELIELTSGADE